MCLGLGGLPSQWDRSETLGSIPDPSQPHPARQMLIARLSGSQGRCPVGETEEVFAPSVPGCRVMTRWVTPPCCKLTTGQSLGSLELGTLMKVCTGRLGSQGDMEEG